MIPKNAITLAKTFEGFRPVPYMCPAGIPTIGWGATMYPDGRRVTLEDPPVSMDAADELLMWELQRCAGQVLTLCPVLAMNEDRLGAIVDFTFNLGSGRLRASTLRRKINKGAWDEVPYQINRWVYGGGQKLRGLVLRRQAEASYFQA
jgi:lysozyme